MVGVNKTTLPGHRNTATNRQAAYFEFIQEPKPLMTEHFGTRLARLIASQHLNQGQFAERLKCSPAFISEVIRGIKKPGAAFLERIHAEFHVSLDWLICGKGDTSPEFILDDFSAIASRVELVLEAAKGDQAAINTVKSFLHKHDYIVDSQDHELMKLRVNRRLEEISYMVSLAKSRKPGEPNEEFYQRALSEAVSKYNALTTDNVTSFLNR